MVRKNAYRQLVSASLGRGDARDGGELPVSRRVRFLSMSLVSMSRFTWFAIKAELEDRINRELQQGLQSSLGVGARGAGAGSGVAAGRWVGAGTGASTGAGAEAGAVTGMGTGTEAGMWGGASAEHQGSAASFGGQWRRHRRAAAWRRRRGRRLLELQESRVGAGEDMGGSTSSSGSRPGNMEQRQVSQQAAEGLLASLSSLVEHVPDTLSAHLKHFGQQFAYNPKPMTGMVAVYFALQVCKKVDLYGFQAYRGPQAGAPPYHYFDRRKGMTWVHSFDLAMEAYLEIGKHNNLFLRDKHNPM